MRDRLTPIDPDKLLREGEAAELLSLSVRTLQSWRRQRMGPPYCAAGRAIRYRRQDVLDWIGANLVPQHAPSPLRSGRT